MLRCSTSFWELSVLFQDYTSYYEYYIWRRGMAPLNLEPLDINSGFRQIEDYLERFEIWCLTQDNLAAEKEAAFFLSVIGKDAYALLKNLVYPSVPISLSYKTLKDMLLRHVKPASFECAERAKFHLMQRSENQGIREFILQLQTQAALCDFNKDLEIQLRDRLIAGINIPVLQRQLLVLPDRTFQVVRAHCEQYQDVIAATCEAQPEDTSVLFNSKKYNSGDAKRQFKWASPSSVGTSTQQKFGNCASCGKQHLRSNCKFRNVTCHNCGKSGHIRAVCRSPKVCRLMDNSEVSDTIHDFNSLSLTIDPAISSHIWKFLFTSNGNSHQFILDTGSVESLIPFTALKRLVPFVKLQSTNVSIRGITGHSLPVIGSYTLSLRTADSDYAPVKFIVIKSGPSVLGLKAMQSLHINISLLSSSGNDTELKDLILRCSKASGGMQIKPVQLSVVDDPVFHKRRVIPYGLRDPVFKALSELCSKGIIEQVQCSA